MARTCPSTRRLRLTIQSSVSSSARFILGGPIQFGRKRCMSGFGTNAEVPTVLSNVRFQGYHRARIRATRWLIRPTALRILPGAPLCALRHIQRPAVRILWQRAGNGASQLKAWIIPRGHLGGSLSQIHTSQLQWRNTCHGSQNCRVGWRHFLFSQQVDQLWIR